MDECIEHCMECERACRSTAQHCLERGSAHAEPGHIRTLLDCADICATAAAFMARDSPRHAQLCGMCAQVCAACAQECRSVDGDDAQMRACAEACERCASSCEEMAGGGTEPERMAPGSSPDASKGAMHPAGT